MMTREEAIKILKDCELNPCVPQDKEAANLAIKALEQQPCEDAISRQAAIDAIRVLQTYKLSAGDDLLLVDQAEAMTELMMLPSAQPEIVRCKDCAKREYCRTSMVWAVAPDDNWYCADAERRTDD